MEQHHPPPNFPSSSSDMRRKIGLLVCSLLVLLGGTALIFWYLRPQDLIPDQSLGRTAPSDKPHVFHLRLTQSQFVWLAMTQRDADLRLDVFDPNGKLITSRDTLQGKLGVEAVALISEQEGVYRVEVSTLDAWPSGRYELTVSGPRVPTQKDRDRASASLKMERARRANTDRNWQEALTLLAGAAQDWEQADEPLQHAVTLWEAAELWGRNGDQQRLLEGYGRVAALLSKLDEPRQLGRVLNKLGTSHVQQGSYEQALDAYDEALRLFSDPDLYRAEVLQNKAFVFRFVGACDEAIFLLSQAESIQRTVGTQRSRADWHNHLGTTYLKCGRLDEALDHLEKALLPSDASHNALVRFRLGQVYSQMEDFERSNEIYGDLLANLPAALVSWKPTLLYYRGLNLSRRGHFDDALTDLRVAAGDMEQLNHPDELYHALLGCARAESGMGRQERALADIERALLLLDEARANGQSVNLAQNYLAFRYNGLDLLVDLMLSSEASGDGQALLERLDQFRTQNLTVYKPNSGSDPASKSKLDALGTRIRQTEWQRAARVREGASHEALDEEINLLLADYERLQAREQMASSPSPARLPFTEMQALLGKGDLLLYYAAGEANLWLIALEKDRLQSFCLGPRPRLEADLLDYISLVRDREPQRVQARLLQASHRLNHLVPPSLTDREDVDRLIIVPDGVLHYLPFAALPLHGDQPLSARFQLVYLPSLAVLKMQRARPHSKAEGITVIADPEPGGSFFKPLPYARLEAQHIAALAPQATVLSGDQAQKERLLSGALTSSRLIHFATHGLIHPKHPELSALVLASRDSKHQPRDAFLYVHEIARLEIGADLVVLSACETGLGVPLRGAGLVGLAQAFLQAGARAVLVSQWDIDDEATMHLMRLFYNHLIHEKPDQALRSAQLEMLASEQWHAPYYWAGFRLIGDWQSRSEPYFEKK